MKNVSERDDNVKLCAGFLPEEMESDSLLDYVLKSDSVYPFQLSSVVDFKAFPLYVSLSLDNWRAKAEEGWPDDKVISQGRLLTCCALRGFYRLEPEMADLKRATKEAKKLSDVSGLAQIEASEILSTFEFDIPDPLNSGKRRKQFRFDDDARMTLAGFCSRYLGNFARCHFILICAIEALKDEEWVHRDFRKIMFDCSASFLAKVHRHALKVRRYVAMFLEDAKDGRQALSANVQSRR